MPALVVKPAIWQSGKMKAQTDILLDVVIILNAIIPWMTPLLWMNLSIALVAAGSWLNAKEDTEDSMGVPIIRAAIIQSKLAIKW